MKTNCVKVAPNTARGCVRLNVADLSSAYALNTLQGVANVETDKGSVRYVVSPLGNYYAMQRRNAPSSSETRFPLARFDCAARVALSALATL